MTNDKFNNQEIELILKALKIRDKDNEYYFDLNNSQNKMNKSDFNHFVIPIKNLISNFQYVKKFEINQKEKHSIICVINENLNKNISDLKVDFYNPIYWLELNSIQKKQLEIIDRHKDILDK